MGVDQDRCPGCGLGAPRTPVRYDGYIHSSWGCWAVYGRLLQAEYQEPARFARAHQLTVDAYAAQHPGGEHPDKSIDVHLVGLHLVLERELPPAQVPPFFRELVALVPTFPHFEPPSLRADAPRVDWVADAGGAEEHFERVRVWARHVWESWSAHHAAVIELAERVFRSQARPG